MSAASVTPTPEAICTDQTCLMCHLWQGLTEPRRQYVARLRVLYVLGRLHATGRTGGGLR